LPNRYNIASSVQFIDAVIFYCNLGEMNWSVGAQSPDSDLIDVALLAAGKALYLCNRFETKCHHALKLMYIAEGMMSDPVVSLEEFIGSLPPDKMLNATLKDIGNVEARTNLVGMSEDDQAVLTKAI
jgi:hypothetical protein